VELTLLLTSNFFVGIETGIPESVVELTDGIWFTNSGQRVLDVPRSSRTLEAMLKDTNERSIFIWRRWKEADNRVAVAGFIYVGIPEPIILLVVGLTCT